MRVARPKELFKVIVNDAAGHSVWIADRDNPPGWSDAGHVAESVFECLEYIRTQRASQRKAASRSSDDNRWAASAASV